MDNVKKPCSTNPRSSLPEQVEEGEGPKGNWLTQAVVVMVVLVAVVVVIVVNELWWASTVNCKIATSVTTALLAHTLYG